MKDGEPAFPTEHLETGYEVQPYMPHPGMSLRDWFAGMALIGIMLQTKAEAQLLTSLAYDIAEAMLAEKERRERRNNDTDRNNPFD